MSGSDYTTTPNYGLYKPVPNADNDVWGDHWNANADTLDSTLKTIQNASGVTSWNSRTGPVTLNTADVTTVLPPSAGTPAMDGTATPGVVNTWSRGDHVHPTDTTRYAASNPAGYVTAAGAATAAPVQSFNTRTGAIVLNNADVTTVLPPSSTTPAMDGTAAVGTGTTWARADHVHPTDTSRAAVSAIPAASSTAPVMDSVATIGVGTTWARADHVHPSDTTRAPLAGVTNGSNAAAGQVGEYLTATLASGSAITLTTNVFANVITLALTAGDWDVDGNVAFTCTNGITNAIGAVSATSANFSFAPGGYMQLSNNSAVFAGAGFPTGTVRFSLAAPATAYLCAIAVFATGPCTAYGTVRARRMR
jgi:hypothetical protein